jgi:sugar lactone lactonase YvrE
MADLTGMLQAAAGATPTGNPNAWDISKAYYDGPGAFDVSKAFYVRSVSVAAQEVNPQAVFFRADGSSFPRMFVLGSSGDDVNQYSLAIPWQVDTAGFFSSYSVSSQETLPNGLYFSPDGTRMYVIGESGDDVNQYSLSVAWDVTAGSATYVQNFSVSSEESSPTGIFFKPDGTKMYISGTGGDDVNEYSLSTAWDISTSSYVQNFSVAAQETIPTDLSFSPDGTKMYVIGSGSDNVNEYSLSTAWDISTSSYVQNFSVAAQDNNFRGLYVREDGSKFYMVGASNDTIYEYTIGGFDLSLQDTGNSGIEFKPDGTKMYVTGTVGDEINEYSLSTAWDLDTASYVQTFNVTAQEAAPTGVKFKTDGTKMYMIGSGSDNVNEYSLSVAWDISTASFVQSFNVNAQEVAPQDLFFKPDGTKMYITGSSGDEVNEYSLSTAWDISTLSYVQNFSVAAQETGPRSLFFKGDGTKMYVCGLGSGNIHEYNLSTAWNISSASYIQSIDVIDGLPDGMFFREDGMQFFIVENNLDRVFSYLISEE